jgi:adenosine deaminase
MRATAAKLLATLLFLLLPAAPATASTNGYLDGIRDDPIALNEFMRELPKGGDIHNHLSGAVYAESMIAWGAADGLCIDTMTFFSSFPPCNAAQLPIAKALTDNILYNEIIAAWSMRGFVPGEISGHDHFFASFDKFSATQSQRKGDALAEVASRAADQNEHYLELLYTAQFGRVNALANEVGLSSDFGATRDALLANGMGEIVAAASTEIDGIYAQFNTTLGCGTEAAQPACALPIRFDYQVLRAMPPQTVFAMLVLGFELQEADPRFVGVNLVQPEDALVALRDYRLQMRMIGFLRDQYEGEHVTLHAGELASGLVPPSDLDFHIGAAVRTAGAERIGHGVSIRHEDGAKRLLRRMDRENILVEQCLTSNKQILEIDGRRHSFPVYRRFGVPVALCTDDEGVSRTDLTEQYRMATREYDLSYGALKGISRDSLRYGFLQDGAKGEAMADLNADFRAFEKRFR